MNKRQMNFSTTSLSSENNIKPVVIYTNVDTLKLQNLKENKSKSGFYRWLNQETGKSYVGSAINLSKRFRIYYSLLSIEKLLLKYNSHIYRAILKYGPFQVYSWNPWVLWLGGFNLPWTILHRFLLTSL